jgi:polyisoprenoid-binding protein YceI
MQIKRSLGTAFLAAGLLVVARQSACAQDPIAVTVQRGTVTFAVKTSVPLTNIEGKSAGLAARVTVRRVAQGLRLEGIEAWTPVAALTTGMDLRDQHMRERVFTAPDGTTPDVRFASQGAVCSAAAQEVTCQVPGNLSFRGSTRPLKVTLKVREENGEFRVTGDSLVKLDQYGIDTSAWGGAVRVENEVQFHFEFTGSRAAGAR